MKEAPKKERIVKVAQCLFSKHGFKGTSIRQLAKEAEVNIAAINYYFKNKLGLYMSCIESVSDEALGYSEQFETIPNSLEEVHVTMEEFIMKIYDFYARKPELLLLTIRELKNKNLTDTLVENSFLAKIFYRLENYFEKLIEKEMISKDYDSFIVASTLFGTIIQSINFDERRKERFDKSLKDNEEFRKEYAKQIANIYVNGLRK